MPQIQHSIPYKKMQNPSSLMSLLLNTNPNNGNNNNNNKRTKSSSSGDSGGSRGGRGGGGGLLKMFKLFPLLTSGCKVVALLASGGRGHHRRAAIADHATIGTLFCPRRGRITLAIQEDPHSMPYFVIELPILSSIFHKEMASSDVLRIALESETNNNNNKTHKKKLMEDFVWVVYCNGRKLGYSVRRKQLSDDEVHVMNMLRGVSMGAGVLPSTHDNNHHHYYQKKENINYGDNYNNNEDHEFMYLRARFERVVGSKDSEALYMINPDKSEGPELSIFFVRAH